MKFSEKFDAVANALTAAQSELKNPYNKADNPYFKSKYAPLHNILNDVRPVLAKHGLSVIQRPATSEDGSVGVETMILHNSGQYIVFEPFYMKLAKNDPQAAGSAITYARRYALNAVLGIAGEDDDDGNEASRRKSDVICPVCGGKVKSAHKDGKEIPPPDVLAKLGMCADCYKEQRRQIQEALEKGKNDMPF